MFLRSGGRFGSPILTVNHSKIFLFPNFRGLLKSSLVKNLDLSKLMQHVYRIVKCVHRR